MVKTTGLSWESRDTSKLDSIKEAKRTGARTRDPCRSHLSPSSAFISCMRKTLFSFYFPPFFLSVLSLSCLLPCSTSLLGTPRTVHCPRFLLHWAPATLMALLVGPPSGDFFFNLFPASNQKPFFIASTSDSYLARTFLQYCLPSG